MSEELQLPELPFATAASHPGVFRYDGALHALVVDAPPHTDLYINPGGDTSSDAESLMNAATLLGVPPAGDFQLSARVSVDFAAQYDAGVLMLWEDQKYWAKFCFEYSPASEPMVVSVVTREVSDDANSFVVDGRSVWMRLSRIDRAYALHASTDGSAWRLVRVFSLGQSTAEHQIGFEAQSPTGQGCTVDFDQITFSTERLADLRDGS
jgi:regulation of enolase protein 1 (concanavalin A-like superfamily)